MPINQSHNASWQAPTRMDALNFWWRSTLLAAWHGLRDTVAPRAKRWHASSELANTPILAQQRTPLWDDGRPEEFPLAAGKVHNLRIACKAFHAVEIPAGETFSFWKQLGRPNARRGFVEGREVREGCVVPTLAGGICQLSNALATAALRSGLELVERHAHSARIEAAASHGSAGTIDATVFWNYIDLKLRAPFAWRLEVEMNAAELIVTIRAASKPVRKAIPLAPARAAVQITVPAARGCLTCDQHQCFRHRPLREPITQGRTALLLDAWSPEFAAYLQQHWPDGDYFIPVPSRLAFWRPANDGWQARKPVFRARWISLRRAIWLRIWASHSGGRRQSSIADGGHWLARTYAQHLRPEQTTLVIDQSLLPHPTQLGALQGRRVIVLANALPMQAIQEKLDAAANDWPQDASLRDYRADPALLQAERDGLARAERIATAHTGVAAQMPAFTNALIDKLTWAAPAACARRGMAPPAPSAPAAAGGLPVIVFPSAALTRKGIRELSAALRGLPCRLRVLGEPPVDRDLFANLSVEYVARGAQTSGDLLEGASIAVMPAHVEHNPRILLAALARGIPVVATPACGMDARDGLHLVPAGDIGGLRAALQALLECSVIE